MKRNALMGLLLCAGITSCVFAASNSEELLKEFQAPPQTAKPFTWWHWVGGNISESGIEKDIEAMANVGLGGVQLFNVTPTALVDGRIKYGSDEWKELVVKAAKLAKSKNMHFTMANCGGWATMGGPHITPDYAMRQIVWTQTRIDLSTKPGEVKIDKFDFENNDTVDLVPSVTMSQGVDLPQTKTWLKTSYKDIVCVAFPTPADEIEAKSPKDGWRLSDWEAKVGNKPKAVVVRDTRKCPNPIKSADIVDLSDKIAEDGSIMWAPPAGSGSWTVVRFGHIITGKPNHPSPVDGRGLEVDKFSAEAAKYHFEKGILPLIKMLNGGGEKLLDAVLTDSYEAKTQNWSFNFRDEFKKRTGIDIVKYMPIFTGRVVDSTEFTEALAWDFRRVAADLITENCYKVIAALCHENGIGFATEGYGRPSHLDDVEVARTSDYPMAEFWVNQYSGSFTTITPKTAATAADLRKIPHVGAESFTSGEDFHTHPGLFKSQGDFYYAIGVNRFIFHTYTHQPFASDVLPGMTLYMWGSHFNRNNTWWDYSMGEFCKYAARTQAVLQNGRLKADVCYYMGEDVPVSLDYAPLPPEVRRSGQKFYLKNPTILQMAVQPSLGYDWHAISTSFLREMQVENGKIVHPASGMSYEILIMPKADFIRPSVLDEVLRLAKAGGKIVMSKPKGVPDASSMGTPERQMLSKVDDIWSEKADSHGARKYGEGFIIEPKATVAEQMETLGIAKDFSYEALDIPEKEALVMHMHRTLPDGSEFYFVTNQSDKPSKMRLSFRTDGGNPQIWDNLSGEVYSPENVSVKSGRTEIVMDMDAGGSCFVVFGAKSAAGAKKNYVRKADFDISKDWTLSFPKFMGSGKTHKLENLVSWTKFDEPLEKYFSGTAVYEKKFVLPEDFLTGGAKRFELEIEKLGVAAKVWVNGQFAGTIWRAPYSLDISKFLKAGENELKINVANAWANRLIGDELLENGYLSKDTVNDKLGRKPNSGGIPPQYEKYYAERYTTVPDSLYQEGAKRPDGRLTYITYPPYKKGRALFMSGIEGSVKIAAFDEK